MPPDTPLILVVLAFTLQFTSNPKLISAWLVCVDESYVFPFCLKVLRVSHEFSIHLVAHLLSNDLPLACIVIQLIEDSVEGQARCEPETGEEESSSTKAGKDGRHFR